MPRRARKESTTGLYHIVFRGINHETVFEKDRYKRKMRLILKEKIKDYCLEIYAYCIMPTHMHILIRGDLKDIASFISRSEMVYAKMYNETEHRNGHVFQNRYYSECVENEKYFWNCINYIHNNPVKAQIVDFPSEYLYSSYAEYVGSEKGLIHEKVKKMLDVKFESIEEFERFSKKNEQDSWFGGTDEEMRTQKSELILKELRKIDRYSGMRNLHGTIKRCDETKKLAERLKVTQNEIIELSVKENERFQMK